MNQLETEDGYEQETFVKDQSLNNTDNITEVVGILNEYSTNLEAIPL